MKRLRALARWVALLVVAFVLVGCSQDDELDLTRWQLSVGDAAKGTVTLPAHLDLPAHDLTYELRSTVRIPADERGRDLTLIIPYWPAPVIARAGGKTLVALREETGDAYRESTARSWNVPAELTAASEIEVELVVERRWSHSGWLDTVPRLRPATETDPASSLVRLVNRVGAACGAVAMFQIGITYLVVFLVDRRRKAYLWFAIQGVTAAYYPFFVLGYSQRLLGQFDVALLSFLLAAAPIASIYFTHAHFGLKKPSLAWAVAMVVAALTVAAQHGPYSVLPMRVTASIVLAAVFYQLVTAVRLLLRQGRPAGAWFLLACWLVLGATAWTDILYWAGIGDFSGGARWACVGLTVFALLQSLMLSGDHIRSLLRADDLNAALADRVDLLVQRQREIEDLNVELRRQIADRSRQLSEAIARIGARRASATELAPGDVVEDRYRVVRVLGSGGMGTVYEVERSSDARRLALKITTSGDELVVARLAREAQIAAGVVHPNVVGIVDVDVATSGVLFLVMEYVAGKSLHGHRERYGDAPWALSILHQVALGLSALHDASIVHRDLKPANILLADGATSAATVKITDFGVSRLRDHTLPPPPPTAEATAVVAPRAGPDDVTDIRPPRATDVERDASSHDSPLTELGALVGTPRYLAPEVAAGAAAGPEADVFAFGIIAFEVLTKRYPFVRSPLTSVLEGHPLEEIAPLQDLCPTLAPSLVSLLRAALDVQPADRPTAAALARELWSATQQADAPSVSRS